MDKNLILEILQDWNSESNIVLVLIGIQNTSSACPRINARQLNGFTGKQTTAYAHHT